MDQKNALNGQEAMPDNKPPITSQPQEQSVEKQNSMETLLEEEGLGLDFPKQGEVRTGAIASVGENEVLVSIGTKSEGVIPARELDQLEDEERAEFVVGNEIPVYVVNPEDPNGVVQLSYLRALEERDWRRAEDLLEADGTFDSKIIGFNKGGLLVPLGRLRGFVPGSQVSVVRRLDAGGGTPEQRWGEMIDEPITARVIEVDRERRRLILSERAALQETRESLKERLLDELEEGDVRTGRVTSLAEFGAFVNIEGADGLVHLSEISWEHVEHPKEVLKVGEEVKVKVINVDYERKRIGLSIRQLQPDPWLEKVDDLKEGQLVEGTITHLTKFGAFARLDEDLEGLIHISELSDQRVAHPKEVVREGDVVTLRVIKIEPERHRIGLSLRKVDSPRYTDFDWKTTLAEVIEETHEEEKETEPDAVEAQVEASDTAGDDMDFPDEEIETAAKAEGESSEGETVEDLTVDAQDTGQPDESGSDQEQNEPVKEAEGQGASAKNQ
jgi:small subunit ribosomal protein S1